MTPRKLPVVTALPKHIIQELRSAGTNRQMERVIKRGVPAKAVLGATKSVVQQMAKQLGQNQDIAEALWQSGFHEARLLAILITNPQMISEHTVIDWGNALWSWDITDHLARYLLFQLPSVDSLIQQFANSEQLYTKRLAFAGIACKLQKQPNCTEEQIEVYCHQINNAADDNRPHVRKALVWALVEIGKLGDSYQHQAIEVADNLINANGNGAWVGRNALKELETLTKVPERRRLLSQNSKTAKKSNV